MHIYNDVKTFGLTGVESFPVTVEADVSDGLPSFNMVGFLGPSLKEAHERVRTAIKNSGFRLPPKRITINLSPAGIRKEGTNYDLAIAAAIISCIMSEIKKAAVSEAAFIGELGLDGSVKPVAGILSMVLCAREYGITRIYLSEENIAEASLIDGLELIGINRLSELVNCLIDPGSAEIVRTEKREFLMDFTDTDDDFADVMGLSIAKRACMVAAAGHHNILLIGPAGTGKTMAARRIEAIIPPMDYEESLETTKIYSIAGLLKEGNSIVTRRPFRTPHHTITSISMAGGGRFPQPGEISLASNGSLFMDELAEYNPQTIDLLRQPMEEGTITVSRLNGTVTFPAKIMVIAAMNPCKCGQYPSIHCSCTEPQRKKYLSRVSGPFRDRIDIGVEVPVQNGDIPVTESTAKMRERVAVAAEMQRERYKDIGIRYNADLSKKLLDEFCAIDEQDLKYLDRLCERMCMSYRSRNKLLKVARTIADLEEERDIKRAHLTEAAAYRTYEQKYWGNNNW